MRKEKIFKFWFNVKFNDGSITPLRVIAKDYIQCRLFLRRMKKEKVKCFKYDKGIYRTQFLERLDVKKKEYKELYAEYLNNVAEYGYLEGNDNG